MENSTNRKSFIGGAVLSASAATLASAAPSAAKASPAPAFDFEVVDSVHLDRVKHLSLQGFEIKAAASAIVPGGPPYAAGNGSQPLNGYYVLMQRKKA